MTHGSLFSGIGGFDVAAEWTGEIENIFQVEINEFCRRVLKKNFPDTKQYKDIQEFNRKYAKEYTNRINIISGGFPCQPFSIAGKRKGTEDDRYLWAEMFETIRIIKPQWCIIENVPGLLTIKGGLVFKKCISDLENENYQTETYIIPAIATDKIHRRDRIWIIANSDSECGWGIQRQEKILSDSKRIMEGKKEQGAGKPHVKIRRNNQINTNSDSKEQTQSEYSRFDGRTWVEVASELCRMDNGFPTELDGFKLSKAEHRNERIKALGNAIVPGIAYEIFQGIIFSNSLQILM